MDDTDGSLALAFDLTALQRLRDPAVAVADAEEWAAHVGVVAAADLPVLTKFTRDNDIDPAFTSGPGGVTAETLADARATHDADRHVYVGTTDAQRSLADEADWEYRSVEAAADAAEWRLGYAPPDRSRTVEERREDWP